MISNDKKIDMVQEALTLIKKGKIKLAQEVLVNLIAELRTEEQ